MNIKKLWKEQPRFVRIILVIVMIIVAIYILSWIKGYISAKNSAGSSSGEESGYKSEGMQASYSDSWYETKADALFDAMDGAGTDDVTVKSIFNELNNELDALKLNRAFGQREYTCYGFSTCSDGLRVWLQSDGVLGAAESILDTNGINYAIK